MVNSAYLFNNRTVSEYRVKHTLFIHSDFHVVICDVISFSMSPDQD